MRIGLITQLHGRPDGDTPTPSWESISARAATAEAVGFDMFVFEDALLYRGKEATDGVWESVSIAAAVAATTSRINLGPSVANSPYRSPAMMAKIADTIDEISGGRFVLGIGAGNTEDSDYEAFGFPTDSRTGAARPPQGGSADQHRCRWTEDAAAGREVRRRVELVGVG